MTEKTVKNPKNTKKPKNPKNKNHLKLKNANVQPKLAESDSDISDSQATGNAPIIDEKAIKQISTEVTDLLASLKKQHGIEDEPKVVTQKPKEKPAEKGKKNKKDVKNAQVVTPAVTAKKAGQQQPKAGQQPKAEKKLPAQQEKTKANENKKQKISKANEVAKKVANTKTAPQNTETTKNKKNTNKKRAADDVQVKTDEPPAKKVKENKKQGKNKPAIKQEIETEVVKAEENSETENEETQETEPTEEKVTEHHLKNAVPIFVGNLPTNIKQIKLRKKFSKFGNILSIRLRTNTGKSFLRKAQIAKVPHLIAFIYFETREAAEAALALNGEKIGDNSINVNMYSKREKTESANTVVVGNLKYAATADNLRETFGCCGEIEYIRVLQNERGCNGLAYIRFVDAHAFSAALELSGTDILGREIRVERYKASKSGEKKGKKEKTPKVKPGQNKNKPQKNAGKGAKPTDAKVAGQKDKKKNKEFLGVKSNDAKKNLNKKKNKKNKLSNEKRLALKVAPKAEKA